MKSIFSKILIVFFALFFTSCAPKNEPQTKIRIVDLKGNSHPVVTRTPELNIQALNSQGVQQSQQQNNIKNAVPPQFEQPNSAPNLPPIAPQNPSQHTNEPAAKSYNNEMMAAGDTNKTIEYDLAKADDQPSLIKKPADKKSKKSAAKVAKKTPAAAAVAAEEEEVETKTAAKTSGGSGKFFVQVGSFSSETNAKNTLAAMKKFHHGKIETSGGEKTIYRVILGPFVSKNQAAALSSKIKGSGHEAIIVKNK
jgi:cell division protein FtsN